MECLCGAAGAWLRGALQAEQGGAARSDVPRGGEGLGASPSSLEASCLTTISGERVGGLPRGWRRLFLISTFNLENVGGAWKQNGGMCGGHGSQAQSPTGAKGTARSSRRACVMGARPQELR